MARMAMIIGELFSGLADVRHGFFTRRGGVSEGCYASLNCGAGSGDDPARVRENRARALVRMGCRDGNETGRLVTAYQVHSARVAVVEEPWADDVRPKVDGLVTRVKGLALGILTADCAPVLLADGRACVIGAAHAGWRGAKAGILEATVGAMSGLGARVETVRAVVGPCIAQASYEVGPEFPIGFTSDEAGSACLFRPAARARHHLFDLSGYIAGRLRGLGLQEVEVLACDTCADEQQFFSYRRTTLAGGVDYGRQLSAIALD